MRIAVPREIKNHEYRVALTPAGVNELTGRGHEVLVESGAGVGSGISDADYATAGAKIVDSPEAVWAEGDLVLKVKEPLPEEYPRLRSEQVLFTYLHLAGDRALTEAVLASGVTGIAYETVQTEDRTLPLLAPMSEVAGRLAPMVGINSLLRPAGGRGILPSGVPGVAPARVVVIGGGVAGLNAATIAVGLRADVELLDTNVARLREIDGIHGGTMRTITANSYTIEQAVVEADLVIGAVLVPGARAPKLIDNELVARMRPGSVLVDISIDQGGCFADSRPTSHDDPTFRVHDSLFYCVTNMPGAVPHTSTHALTNVTLPYVTKLADRGWRAACASDRSLAGGLNVHQGTLVNAAVGQAHSMDYVDVGEVVGD
ncbi:alanine dehydrogenase [Actinoalloteichus hymeniacidonis]|uniref:Alanine dehydrogenase n=1 Tax=Actinoalloteichus hymeniacidonis TaxID=340345 RepID=A0AAC9HUU7_9PSEU|nr:alanine dehydrogenase [Actinoalloteichus hymeniacidonis]AOS65376.1 alanine dehydrogenase [Actinoalloteichus hymeniacidonis]MBB5906538.1 alanine dehydrogenase [Actinoalloteichus hymeniacidonis]